MKIKKIKIYKTKVVVSFDDDTKIDDDKKIFNLKTIIHKIKEQFKHKENKNNADYRGSPCQRALCKPIQNNV